MTNATSAKGVGLYIQDTAESETWTKFLEVSAVPEVGQSAERIDVTHLDSEMKEYVKDIPDFSSELEFTMNSIPKGVEGSNLDLIMSLDQDASYNWKIVYPQQKIQCVIKGQFSWRMGAGEVSAKQDLILAIIPQSAPVWTEYTATVSLTYEEETAPQNDTEGVA